MGKFLIFYLKYRMIKPLTCILISDTIIPDRKFIGNKSNKAKQFDLRKKCKNHKGNTR